MIRTIEQFRRLLSEQLPQLAEEYHVSSLALFGSYVRGEATPASDLDVLVTFRRPPSLLRLIKLEQFLSDELAVKVDLVVRDSLKPYIGRRILAEATPV